MPEHTPAPTPSRAVYGFAMYLSFRTFFILYVIWAVIPEEWFKFIGITCLPQRYWAISIPILFLNVLTVFAFVIYPSMGRFMTPGINDLRVIEDSAGIRQRSVLDASSPKQSDSDECTCIDKNKCLKHLYDNECGDFIYKSIPDLQDLNIWEVSDHLYLNNK